MASDNVDSHWIKGGANNRATLRNSVRFGRCTRSTNCATGATAQPPSESHRLQAASPEKAGCARAMHRCRGGVWLLLLCARASSSPTGIVEIEVLCLRLIVIGGILPKRKAVLGQD